MDNLIHVLELSVNKHGKDTPITLGHLLNIVKLAQKYEERADLESIRAGEAVLDDVYSYGVNQ
jgi:hypothetical protein